MTPPSDRATAWPVVAPGLFVVLWSTGFIGAKLGVPYVEPFTFLTLRFVFVIALMLPLAFVLRARWPQSPRETIHIAVAGGLIQGGYLGGCFAAVAHGMPAGVIALMVGLQPVLTAFAAAPLLGETVSAPPLGGAGRFGSLDWLRESSFDRRRPSIDAAWSAVSTAPWPSGRSIGVRVALVQLPWRSGRPSGVRGINHRLRGWAASGAAASHAAATHAAAATSNERIGMGSPLPDRFWRKRTTNTNRPGR